MQSLPLYALSRGVTSTYRHCGMLKAAIQSLQRPEYSEFYLPRQRIFLKNTIRKKNVLFLCRTCETHFPQPQIFALNLAYTGNWTHAQHKADKIAIYIYLVLTFFLDHHILCLQLLVKIHPLSLFTYFLQTQTNHCNCVSYYYFRENKSIVRSLSPPLRLGFLTSCFPDLLSKNKSPRSSFQPSPL